MPKEPTAPMSMVQPIFFGDGECGATFSACRTWRYCLWRRWSARQERETRIVAFVGLNPSTADESVNDPTVRRCIAFAKRWEFDGLAMLNLFAYRATAPADMKAADDCVGELNDEAIKQVASVCAQTICCWGADGGHLHRGSQVKQLLSQTCGRAVWHLGFTLHGHPKHPLYLRSDTERVRWA